MLLFGLELQFGEASGHEGNELRQNSELLGYRDRDG
jgi:hypothetical protein